MRRHIAAQHDDAVLVEFLVRARRAEPLQVFGRGVGMEMHREQLALDQVRLRRLAQADGDVGLAHGEVELFVGGDQRDVDVRIEIEEFAEPRRQPMHADAGRGRHLEFAVRPLAAVGELGARRLQLHEHFMRRAVEHVALFGEDQAAGVAVKQRDRQLGFQRRNLARDRRLRQPEPLAGMGEGAGLGRGVKHFQLVPVHRGVGPAMIYSAAARWCSCAARNFSASSAAMQPWPAAVTAWR